MAEVKLTPSQLAGLDFLIAAKRENPLIITDIANDVKNVTQAVTAVTAVTALVAGGGQHAEFAAPGEKPEKALTLEQLIQVRSKVAG